MKCRSLSIIEDVKHSIASIAFLRLSCRPRSISNVRELVRNRDNVIRLPEPGETNY